jgi:G:T-mismatch repair DNA endonuclease (very short patch repair protein)
VIARSVIDRKQQLVGWKVIVVWECHLRIVSSAKLELAEIELIQKLADAINGV